MPSISWIPEMELDYNISVAELLGRRTELSSKGYRPISLCMHGDPFTPFYTVVWIQRPGPPWEMLAIGSKVFTALGILRLTELPPEKLPQGLSTPFTTILAPALPAPGAISDPDLSKRTLDQLLAHLGKFKDDETVREILDVATVVYPAVGEQLLPGKSEPVQMAAARAAFEPKWYAWYALTQDDASLLAYKNAPTPGLLTPTLGGVGKLPTPDYSNLGYFFLGQVIENVTTQPYGNWLQEQVLGRGHMSLAELSVATASDAAEASNPLGPVLEARYHPRRPAYGNDLFAPDSGALAPFQYGTIPALVAQPLGGWALPAFETAWIFSRLDPKGSALFDKAATTVDAFTLVADERFRVAYLTPDFFQPFVQHNGALQGTNALAFRRSDGLTIAITANTDIVGDLHMDAQGRTLATLATGFDKWPPGDLFTSLLPST